MLSSSAIYRLKTHGTHFYLSQGKRLTGSFGSMHGVKIPDTATPDDKPSEELPYMEMLYRFVFGKKSYYDLQITKDVKAARLARWVSRDRARSSYARACAPADDAALFSVVARARST